MTTPSNVKPSERTLSEDLVSIISPAYNSAHFLPDMIESVHNQSYAQWELLIVIDQGTVDNTETVVNSFSLKDPRVRLLKVTEGKGLALSRNFGLMRAKGQYIAFLDSDDLWIKSKLEKQIEWMKNKRLAISCTAFRRVSEDLTTVGQLLEVPESITYNTLLINNVMGCLTVVIDQAQTGLLQMLETKHEDYLLWLSLLKKGFPCGGLNEDLARYRIVKNSRSANKKEMIFYRWKILRLHQGLGLISSIKFLFLYGVTSIKKYARF